jgi:hypothetical protein
MSLGAVFFPAGPERILDFEHFNHIQVLSVLASGELYRRLNSTKLGAPAGGTPLRAPWQQRASHAAFAKLSPILLAMLLDTLPSKMPKADNDMVTAPANNGVVAMLETDKLFAGSFLESCNRHVVP